MKKVLLIGSVIVTALISCVCAFAADTPAAPELSGVYYDYANDILHARGVSPEVQSDVDYFEYRITKDALEGIVIKDWTNITAMLYPVGLKHYFVLEASGLGLDLDGTYYFSARAVRMPQPSTPVYSEVVSMLIPMKDTTPPTPPVVNIISYTASTDTLLVCGSSYDMESGVNRFEYKVTKGATVIRNWTAQAPGMGSRPDQGFYAYTINAQGMNLKAGGTFTVSVKAVNNDEVVSSIVSKDTTIKGVVAPPTTPVVNIISYTASTDTLLVCGSSYGMESPVVRFEYKVTKGATVIRNWTAQAPGIGSRPDRKFYAYTINAKGMNLKAGGTFTVSVKAINAAGVVSNIGSKSKTIPATP